MSGSQGMSYSSSKFSSLSPHRCSPTFLAAFAQILARVTCRRSQHADSPAVQGPATWKATVESTTSAAELTQTSSLDTTADMERVRVSVASSPKSGFIHCLRLQVTAWPQLLVRQLKERSPPPPRLVLLVDNP